VQVGEIDAAWRIEPLELPGMMLVLSECCRGDGAESAGERKATIKLHVRLPLSDPRRSSLFKLKSRDKLADIPRPRASRMLRT
jgi:hypothetical protein